MEWLSSLFLGAFLFGVLFCAASLVLGVGQVGLDDLGLDLEGPDGDGQSSGNVKPWNFTGLTAFVAWFGGVGYLAITNWQLAAWVSLVLATLAGLVGWGIVYLFFKRVLLRGEARMNPEDYQLEGTIARVTVPILAGRIGEIQYEKAGSRRSDGARSADGSAIPRDAEVVVVGYDRGIAYVERWHQFLKGEAPEGR